MLALLFLPVALMIAVIVIDLLARRGCAPAEAFVSAYESSPALIKLLSLLMLMVAAIHLGLIPAHWRLDPVRCIAFAAEAAALVGLAGWAISGTGWQPATAALMVANLLGYWYYVANGLEAFELIGVFSKLIEVACLTLVVAVSTREVANLGFGRNRARSKAGRA